MLYEIVLASNRPLNPYIVALVLALYVLLLSPITWIVVPYASIVVEPGIVRIRLTGIIPIILILGFILWSILAYILVSQHNELVLATQKLLAYMLGLSRGTSREALVLTAYRLVEDLKTKSPLLSALVASIYPFSIIGLPIMLYHLEETSLKLINAVTMLNTSGTNYVTQQGIAPLIVIVTMGLYIPAWGYSIAKSMELVYSELKTLLITLGKSRPDPEY